MRVKNTGSVMPITSVVVPSGRYSFTAMPRASWVVSGIVGSPAPFEKRTCARTGSPLKWAAFERAPPAPEAVKVAAHNTPLA